MPLKSWRIFNNLSDEFKYKIRIAYVYGLKKKEAIIIDENDDVYVIKIDSDISLDPQKIDILCNKKICNLAYGNGHVIALNKYGETFGWGRNDFFQICEIRVKNIDIPKPIQINEKVIEIACGWKHTAVLTDNGQVFAWGFNFNGQIGNGTTIHAQLPVNITQSFKDENSKIKSIVCGAHHSVALFNNGNIYLWGSNDGGQLGMGSNDLYRSKPCRAELNGVKIESVVCGSNHTLALSDDGNLYSWGYNEYGQLGNGHIFNQNVPLKIAYSGIRFIEIAASHYNHLSAAMSTDGKYFVWGLINDKSLITPSEIKCDFINDIFALYARSAATYKPIKCYEINL